MCPLVECVFEIVGLTVLDCKNKFWDGWDDNEQSVSLIVVNLLDAIKNAFDDDDKILCTTTNII